MKKTLVLVLAASVVTAMLAGCAGKGEYYSPEESLTFGVDAASVALDTNALDVTMTHHGTLKEGIDGWTFQVYIDADHDAATGVNGADYFINGFEGRSAGGYAIRKAMPNHTWGPVVGYAGSDDGNTLTVPVSRSVVPMSAGIVRLAVYAQHKLVHDQTFDVN
jgi:hypothetical protein